MEPALNNARNLATWKHLACYLIGLVAHVSRLSLPFGVFLIEGDFTMNKLHLSCLKYMKTRPKKAKKS